MPGATVDKSRCWRYMPIKAYWHDAPHRAKQTQYNGLTEPTVAKTPCGDPIRPARVRAAAFIARRVPSIRSDNSTPP